MAQRIFGSERRVVATVLLKWSRRPYRYGDGGRNGRVLNRCVARDRAVESPGHPVPLQDADSSPRDNGDALQAAGGLSRGERLEECSGMPLPEPGAGGEGRGVSSGGTRPNNSGADGVCPETGLVVIYDTDDLMFEQVSESWSAAPYQAAMKKCDVVLVSTCYLATKARKFHDDIRIMRKRTLPSLRRSREYAWITIAGGGRQ